MKRKTTSELLLTLAVLLMVAVIFLLPTQARATTKPEPPAASPSTTSSAGSKSGSKSGAKAGSKATTGDQVQGLSTGDDRSRFLSLAFPPPAFTPPMAPVDGCAAEVRQDAGAITLLGSKAAGITDPSVCHLFTLRNLKVQQCQYATAKRIEDRLIAKMLPDFPAPPDLGYVDLSREACAAVHAPPVVATAQNLVANAPAQEQTQSAVDAGPPSDCKRPGPPARPAKPVTKAASRAAFEDELCRRQR